MSEYSQLDTGFMQEALRLAEIAKGKTFPNPAVGAVIVSKNKIVGKGATQVYGGPHAEKVALADAGKKAAGATLYVTLEPCCHFGRTPPCTDSIIEAGIKKVIVAIKDPNPLVGGKGLNQLRKNGIEVKVGLLKKEAHAINEDFFWSIIHKRSWVTLKLAMTLDGKIADEFGGSKWITGEKARSCVQEFRRCHAAIAVGKATLLADNPQLTVRHKKGYTPARIVFSTSGKIPQDRYFVEHASEARSVVVVQGGEAKAIEHRSGIEYWYTGKSDIKSELSNFLEMAYEQRLSSIFIEGGQQIASLFLKNGLVNRIHFFYGHKILGKGKDGILFSSGLPVNDSITLKNVNFQALDQDFLITGNPEYDPGK